MTWHQVRSGSELETRIRARPVLGYFSHDACGVCKVIRPKLSERFERDFEQIDLCYVDVQALPDVAASYGAFAVPTVVLFIEGKESLRVSRNLSIDDFASKVARLYALAVE